MNNKYESAPLIELYKWCWWKIIEDSENYVILENQEIDDKDIFYFI